MNSIMKLSTSQLPVKRGGFFQLVNHGIDWSLYECIEKVANDFFHAIFGGEAEISHGTGTVQGYGQAFIFSENQKLDWCNMFALGVEPHFLRVPTLWPLKPAELSETLEGYSREMRKLCQILLEYIAVSLGLKEDVFEEMFGVCVQADLVRGLSPHSDGSALTVQKQRRGSSVGLQILKDNAWVPVQPMPNALLTNIGDTIEVLTNGKYKSMAHRAVTNKETDRLSIVTFYAPSYEIEIGPRPEFVDENNQSKYRRYNHGEYSKNYVTNKLQGEKSLDFAKI